MRRVLPIVLAIACLFPVPASGQGTSQAPSFIQSATVDYRFLVPLTELQENRTLYEREEAPCPDDNFEIDASQQFFAFSESQGSGPTEGGCGEIGFRLEAPRADALYLTFTGNRDVTSAAGAGPVSALQQFRVYGSDDALLFQHDYFDPSSPQNEDELVFYELGQFGAQPLNLTWYFEDRGPTASLGLPSVQYGQRMVGEVRSPAIIVQGAPLTTERLGSQVNVTGNISTTRTFEQVRLQPLVTPTATNLTLRVLLTAERSLEEVRAADGSALNITRLATQQTDQGLVVEITEDQSSAHPVGNYLFVFRKDNPLPPPPPPPAPAPPTTIYPFALLLIALPAVPAAFATRTSFGLRSAADYRHRPFVTHVFGIGVAFLLVYAGLFVYVMTGGQLSRMATLPIETQGWILYIEFAALALIFVLLWVAPARRLVSLMRRDLTLSEQVQEQLRRSNKELEQFAYIASHDLQEPLRTITGFSQILRSKYASQLDPQAKKFLELNADSAQRMQRLIHGLLAYSRVESRPLEKTNVNLADVFADVLRDVDRLRLQQKGTIRVHPLPQVRADPVQMRQLFLNLVQNALKYRDPSRDPEIVINAETDADYHIIAVRDNGRGIEPKYFEKVFDMFQRLEPRNSSIEGTGLGLAVVKKIVARHDGRIWIDVVPSGGSIFKVALPRHG